MIDLTWREIRQISVEDYQLYDALYSVYIYYIGNYIEELIKYASPYEYSVGDIDAEDITELVTGDEFLEKFKKWYLND